MKRHILSNEALEAAGVWGGGVGGETGPNGRKKKGRNRGEENKEEWIDGNRLSRGLCPNV